MSWIPGLWMGLFWVGLGLFVLVSSWMGRASFYVPRLNINMGWIIIVLGVLRIWWWWKSEELPARKKRETRAELQQMKREIAQAQAQDTTEEPTATQQEPEQQTESKHTNQ